MARRSRLFALVSFALGLAALVPVHSAFAQSGSAVTSTYPAEKDLIEVLFAADARVRLRSSGLVDLQTNALDGIAPILARAGRAEWLRFSDVSEGKLDEMAVRGTALSGEEIYNLNNIYRLRVVGPGASPVDVWQLSRDLEALPGVLSARPVPLPMPAPIPPNYQPSQNYEDPAAAVPTGVDAEYAWTRTGGTGTGVTVCDIEYSWNYNHNDVTKAFGSQINVNVVDPFSDTNHGTAVVGELVSDDNGWGTKGVCYGANLKTCGSYYGLPGPSWNVAGAIALAASVMGPGDVILLEQQWDYTGGAGYVPVEWWTNVTPNPQTQNAVWMAIKNATANRIHVVEAGGNGNMDTNLLGWTTDSGAIIVGAGGAYPGGAFPQGNLERLSFSSYGSRFHMQGWGENVVTTGYGNLYSAEGVNRWYTNSFNGTSSASPIVAGAVACIQGFWFQNVQPQAPPTLFLRNIIRSLGTPQVFGLAGAIGPRPNCRAVMEALIPDVGQDYGDAPEGVLAYPSSGVFGQFPTCQNVGPADTEVHHIVSDSLFFGNTVDFEQDGNWTWCPTFPPYDADECWNTPDAGLLFPPPYTISAGSVVQCSATQPACLGPGCTVAFWGGSVDITVTNNTASEAYVNVLMDWNQDGMWAGGSTCPPGNTPEHILNNLVVPAFFSGPISWLGAPPFRLGSDQGFVWARFTVSDQGVGFGWDGAATFLEGETEDYLLCVDANPTDVGDLDVGARILETRLVPGKPNPFRSETTFRAEIAVRGKISVDVYDVTGRRVRELFEGERVVGSHDFVWDGRDAKGRQVSAGVYFVRMQTGGKAYSSAVTLMR